MHETPKPEDFRNTDFSSLIRFRIKRILMICSNLAVSMIFPCACIEDIDLDTDHEKMLVANCILTESEEQTLELFWTSKMSEDTNTPVESAQVILIGEDNSTVEFHKCEDGLWRTTCRPEYNGHYRLFIKAEDKELSSDTIFPEDISVDTYGKLRWKDKQSGIDYLLYSYELRIYDVFIPPYYGRECNSASHLWIFPRDLGWGENYQRYIATTHAHVDNFNVSPLSVCDLPCFSADSLALTPQWLKRQLSWIPDMLGYLQMHERLVRINIPPNYHNGMSQEDLKNSPVYSDKAFALVRDLPAHWNGTGPYDENLYDIYILSEEADKYFKDVYRRHLNKNNFVFEYDTENIYTNVHGGLGVFGAMIHRSDKPGVSGYLNDWNPE